MAADIAGHQVGGELHAAVAAAQRLAQRAHQQGLAQAGYAFDQHVATGEQHDEDLVEHVVLADEGLGDFVADGGGARYQRFTEDRLRRGRGVGVPVSWLVGMLVGVLVGGRRGHSRFLSWRSLAMRSTKSLASPGRG